MKRKIIIFSLLVALLFGFTPNVWCGKIVYPWRSTTAIVKAGNSFEVWFDADAGQTVDAVELKGPYNSVSCTMSVTTGNWQYDQMSGNTYNTKIMVTVPDNAPAERYDLILKTSKTDEISFGGVKVVKEFKDNYYIMHMSDGHVYQGGYDPVNLFSKKSVMIDMANIMDCQIIVETGDNMYNVRNHPEREEQYFLGIESLGVKGMAKATAATFLVPGDHDGYSGNAWENSTADVNADFFNDYWGMQNSCFKYGNGRFMMLNNAWDVSTSSAKDHKYQTDDAVEWLKNEGTGGNFLLTAGHCYNKMHQFINNYATLDLVIAGDKHHIGTSNPYEFATGTEEVAYIARSIRDHFQFNLYKVDNTAGTFTTVSATNALVDVLESGDMLDRSTWIPNLTLSYVNPNDGTFANNTATIVNKFDFPIDEARVRFVIPKGEDFNISAGTVAQSFEGDEVQVVDVTIDLQANRTKTIFIGNEDLCPDDPNKTAPGLCGCGVPEGSCDIAQLTVDNGYGSGNYYPFEYVHITADAPPIGKTFDKWVVNSGNPAINDINSSETLLQIVDGNVTISATYKNLPPENKATFISQLIPPLQKGATATVTITMKNMGSTIWTKEDGYMLGSINPQDNETWGVNRVFLNDGETIEPGEEKTFTFDITAPAENGSYTFQWQMLQEDVEWFGDETFSQSLNIGASGRYLDDCDSNSGWTIGSNGTLNTTDKKQGNACLQYSGSGTDEYKKTFSPAFDAFGSEEGTVIQFWYYISDPTLLTGKNQLEIGSAGKPDTDEYSWSITGLSAGWNFIRLNFKDATKTDEPNLSAINWFRFYNFKSGSVVTRIDAIEIIGDGEKDGFNLTINNGYGSGYYKTGETIMIQAENAPNGKVFDKWVFEAGSASLVNVNMYFTTLTMADSDVVLTATYKDDDNTTNIQSVENDSWVNIYPNPLNSNLLYIDLCDLDDIKTVEVKITNLTGQIVYNDTLINKRKIMIDTGKLPANSMYIVTVKVDNTISNIKLMKK